MNYEQEFNVFDNVEGGIQLGDIWIQSKGEIPTFQEMPQELEINGFVYKIEI